MRQFVRIARLCLDFHVVFALIDRGAAFIAVEQLWH
jgi:hypothetical protein